MREETARSARLIVVKHLRVLSLAAASALSVGVCGAQEPAFESASVKVADPANRPSPDKRTSGGPGTDDPGHFYFANAGMGELIMRAYGIKADQLSAPCWILGVKRCANETVNFEISATMPADTTGERFDGMLRNLLTTRFGLVVHHLTRNVPGYELFVEGGSVSPENPVAPPGDEFWSGRGILAAGSVSGNSERAWFRERSMAEFVAHLEGMVGLALGMDGEKVGKPRITDKTGLTGTYSFAFGSSCPCFETVGYQFPGGLSNDPAGVPLPNTFDALRDQLGLKLVKTADVPVDVIVVDQVERAPIS